MAKNKEKYLNANFNYDGNNPEYNLELKKKPNLWWLLLLLLPLVLLIPLKKDITVYTQLDGQAEPFVDVSMNYTAHYLLWNKKFNVKVPYDTIQQTDDTGKTVFKDLGYSVYSFIFKSKSPIVFNAGGEECFDSITKSCRFHTTRKAVLDMQPHLSDVRLKVVDKELRFVLPGAKVKCEYMGRNGMLQTIDTTDAAGCVVLKDARSCGGFNSVNVSADGYADTLLTDLTIPQLLADAGGYVIPLRPLKDRFTFFVKNKYTKQPIPDALAEVMLMINGQQGTINRSKTNVDGLGQGFYENARILATVGIMVSKAGYYDSTFVAPPGKPNPMTVREFTALPDSLRVIWLRPKPHTEQFRNVDTLSLQPIAGVKNEIVIEGIDGTTKHYTATSNRNGYFDVTALPGDKISIKSALDPYYYPKNTVIDKFEKAEIVYMRPRMATLEFRTVEMVDGQIYGVLPNCELVITVDGKQVNPTNSGNGNFSVPNLRFSSTISIVASKQYYTSNSTKVRNRIVSDLYQAKQDARDIPLEIDRVCGQLYDSEEHGVADMQVKFLHVLGKSSGSFKFKFQTRPQEDAFEIWNCRPEEVIEANRSKYFLLRWPKSDFASTGWNHQTLSVPYSKGPFITVVAIRSDNNSYFDYVICCPDEDCEVNWPHPK